MNPQIKSISDASVRGKRVFVRCDFDISVESGKIIDDSRLVSAIGTIEYLLSEGAEVIAAGHMGRPDGFESSLSLAPVAQWFGKQFDKEIESSQLRGFEGWLIKDGLIILENLRFYAGEEENALEFAESLASLADIYVNEAFGVCHRENSSIVGVPKLLPHFAGFHLIKELKILSQILYKPKRPLTIIVGGAKIETKLPLISKMHQFADFVLVGGELAEETKTLAHMEHEKIRRRRGKIIVADLISSQKDITDGSLNEFKKIINESEMVVWNGPMGEINDGKNGSSLNLAEIIINSTAYSVVGGGDTVGFLNTHGLVDKFDFVSVGGGAMLEYLSGEKLPGLIALEN